MQPTMLTRVKCQHKMERKKVSFHSYRKISQGLLTVSKPEGHPIISDPEHNHGEKLHGVWNVTYPVSPRPVGRSAVRFAGAAPS